MRFGDRAVARAGCGVGVASRNQVAAEVLG